MLSVGFNSSVKSALQHRKQSDASYQLKKLIWILEIESIVRRILVNRCDSDAAKNRNWSTGAPADSDRCIKLFKRGAFQGKKKKIASSVFNPIRKEQRE